MISRDEIVKRLVFNYKLPRSWHRDFDLRLWTNGKCTITDKEICDIQHDHRCQVCRVVTSDIRHIGIECFFELHEVSEKFRIVEDKRDGHTIRVYMLKVCKGCRAVFMFDCLATFIRDGGHIRKEKSIDEDGITELHFEVV